MTEEFNLRYGQLFAGLLVAGLGVALLFDRLWGLPIDGIYQLWPLILLLIGLANLIAPGDCGHRHGGWSG